MHRITLLTDMKNKIKRICLTGVFLFWTFGTMAQKPDFVTAKASEVFLYSNSAEIAQSVNISLQKGANIIVVKNKDELCTRRKTFCVKQNGIQTELWHFT